MSLTHKILFVVLALLMLFFLAPRFFKVDGTGMGNSEGAPVAMTAPGNAMTVSPIGTPMQPHPAGTPLGEPAPSSSLLK